VSLGFSDQNEPLGKARVLGFGEIAEYEQHIAQNLPPLKSVLVAPPYHALLWSSEARTWSLSWVERTLGNAPRLLAPFDGSLTCSDAFVRQSLSCNRTRYLHGMLRSCYQFAISVVFESL